MEINNYLMKIELENEYKTRAICCLKINKKDHSMMGGLFNRRKSNNVKSLGLCEVSSSLFKYQKSSYSQTDDFHW